MPRILRPGARWNGLPEQYPPYHTRRRRSHLRVRSGVVRVVGKAKRCNEKKIVAIADHGNLPDMVRLGCIIILLGHLRDCF